MFSWFFKPKSLEQLRFEEEVRQRKFKEEKEQKRLADIEICEQKIYEAKRKYEEAKGSWEMFRTMVNATGRVSLYDKEHMVQHNATMQASQVDMAFWQSKLNRLKSFDVK